MLSKVGLFVRTVRVASKRLMSDYGGHHNPTKSITYNDLPVPSGSWQQAYNAKQRRYNLYLLSSILFFSGTVGFIYADGTFDYLRSPLRLPLD